MGAQFTEEKSTLSPPSRQPEPPRAVHRGHAAHASIPGSAIVADEATEVQTGEREDAKIVSRREMPRFIEVGGIVADGKCSLRTHHLEHRLPWAESRAPSRPMATTLLLEVAAFLITLVEWQQEAMSCSRHSRAKNPMSAPSIVSARCRYAAGSPPQK